MYHTDMHRTLVLLLYCALAVAVKDVNKRWWSTDPEPTEKCYDDLGCWKKEDFTHESRRDPYLPSNLSEIDTHFYLLTNESKTDITNIGSQDIATDLKNNTPTVFIVHGFHASGDSTWVPVMGRNILAIKAANVIVVDWKKGAASSYNPVSEFGYKYAASNTWVVGGQIWQLTNVLNEKFDVKFEDMHIIGHSLGAHVAGYAGARHQGKLGRISGLDPAEPEFQNTPPDIRLDPTDAMFVDVIHTDSNPYITVNGFGMKQPVGHVDFYPNGGESQPGCLTKRDVISKRSRNISKRQACEHGRSYEYYTQSLVVRSCAFVGHECSSYEEFGNGKCNSCGQNGTKCLKMGYFANEYKNPTGSVNHLFYLVTSSEQPYCAHQYSITLDLQDQPITYGLTLQGTSESHSFELKVGSKSLTRVTGSPMDLGPIKQLDLSCESGHPRLCHQGRLVVKSVKVEPLNIVGEAERKAATTVLCPKEQTVTEPETPYTFDETSCQVENKV